MLRYTAYEYQPRLSEMDPISISRNQGCDTERLVPTGNYSRTPLAELAALVPLAAASGPAIGCLLYICPDIRMHGALEQRFFHHFTSDSPSFCTNWELWGNRGLTV